MRLIVVLIVALSLPATAFACSCVAPFETDYLAPAMDATDVPTNARVWIGGAHLSVDFSLDPDELPTLWLETEAGDLVPSTTTRIVSSWHLIAVLTPDVDLAPDTVHIAWMEDDTAFAPIALLEFRTGFDADTEAPAIPTTTSHRVHADSAFPDNTNSCGPTDGVSLEVSSDETLVVSNLLGRAVLDAEGVDGELSDFRTRPDGMIWLTSGACSSAWPDVEIGAQAEWQLGAFDLAGNFSGWSQVETAQITTFEANATGGSCNDGSCSAVGGASSGWMLLPLLLGLRRRRA